MSAELLRQVTIERVNRAIGDLVAELTELHDQPLDVIRLVQGKIAGMKQAVAIQNEASKGLG